MARIEGALRSVVQSPRLHLAAGAVALIASAVDVLDIALVDLVGFNIGSEVPILSIATLHVLKGIVDVTERSQRLRQERHAARAEA